MKTSVVAVAALSVLGSLAFLAQGRQGGQVGDPKTPVFWSAQQMKDLDARAAARVSPKTNMAGERLLASASLIYRTGWAITIVKVTPKP